MTYTTYSNRAVADILDGSTCLGWTDYVEGSLGDYVSDYDVAAIVDEYVDAINDVLPEGFRVVGDAIHREINTDYIEPESLRSLAEEVNFWEIAEKHEISGK